MEKSVVKILLLRSLAAFVKIYRAESSNLFISRIYTYREEKRERRERQIGEVKLTNSTSCECSCVSAIFRSTRVLNSPA